jgi:hypothetical protein
MRAFDAVRGLIAVACVGLFCLGLYLLFVGDGAAVAGIWPLVAGGGGLIAVVLERQRYRSEAADRSNEPPGPGGGEPAALPPQFQATEERFVDPTRGRVMRVFLDERTGERRYRAEA